MGRFNQRINEHAQLRGRNPAYDSSKAAQIALGRAIARAGEEKGIRCNVIAPVSSTFRWGATPAAGGRIAR
jgi:NAD(P)-dependent dehydrogenase (short-subunit alcohol dehydrogenase family)